MKKVNLLIAVTTMISGSAFAATTSTVEQKSLLEQFSAGWYIMADTMKFSDKGNDEPSKAIDMYNSVKLSFDPGHAVTYFINPRFGFSSTPGNLAEFSLTNTRIGVSMGNVAKAGAFSLDSLSFMIQTPKGLNADGTGATNNGTGLRSAQTMNVALGGQWNLTIYNNIGVYSKHDSKKLVNNAQLMMNTTPVLQYKVSSSVAPQLMIDNVSDIVATKGFSNSTDVYAGTSIDLSKSVNIIPYLKFSDVLNGVGINKMNIGMEFYTSLF